MEVVIKSRLSHRCIKAKEHLHRNQERGFKGSKTVSFRKIKSLERVNTPGPGFYNNDEKLMRKVAKFSENQGVTFTACKKVSIFGIKTSMKNSSSYHIFN